MPGLAHLRGKGFFLKFQVDKREIVGKPEIREVLASEGKTNIEVTFKHICYDYNLSQAKPLGLC